LIEMAEHEYGGFRCARDADSSTRAASRYGTEGRIRRRPGAAPLDSPT